MAEDLLDFTEDDSGDWILGESGGEGANSPTLVYPPGYASENAKLCYKLCLLGATDKELADFFEIEDNRFQEWRRKVPEFEKARIDGKTVANANVAQAMYQRAIGCAHDEDKVISYMGDATIVRIKRHYPPDVAAGQFWLATRERDRWGKNALGHGDEGQGFVQVFYPDGWDEEEETD